MALQEELEQQGNFLFRYRGILPIFLLLPGLLAYLQHIKQLTDKGVKTDNELYFFFCLAVTLVGFGIRIYTVGHSAANTSGRNTNGQLADDLNTTGIYSVVRHPLYIGNFFMWFGFALLSKNLWFILAFIFIYWIYYERIMFAEEQFLRKKFGNRYLEWAAVTQAFIPKFSHFKLSLTGFDLRKVINQEKTGLLLIGILYFLFHETGTAILMRKISVHYNSWFYLMIVSIAIYVTIKLTQKKTYVNVLHRLALDRKTMLTK